MHMLCPFVLGPLRRTIFPYEFHFRSINTHILIDHPLEGNLENDRRMVLDALAQGRSFVANDMLAPARGFRFIAHGFDRIAMPGEEITAERRHHISNPASGSGGLSVNSEWTSCPDLGETRPMYLHHDRPRGLPRRSLSELPGDPCVGGFIVIQFSFRID